MKIGVCLESTGFPLRQALPKISHLGISGVQIDASGELSPEKLTDTGKREIRNLLKTYSLTLTALNCPLRFGIDVATNQEARIAHIKRVMDLAFDLGARLVVVQLPKLPLETEVERSTLLREALLALGQYGDRMGSLVALEIGIDPTIQVRDYVKGFDVGSLGINYDPANLLINGHEPVQSLIPLQGMILHTHARDARANSGNSSAQEVPLGHGHFDWMSYMLTLHSIGYRGWNMIERGESPNRLGDVAAGYAFLRRVTAI